MSKEFESSYRQLADLLGSKVELVITSGLYKGNYSSRLDDLENDLIGVSHPMLRGAFLPALRSTEMLMKIETSNCFYQATVSVVRGVVNVAVPLLWLKFSSALEKVQRRMFVRVFCSIKADAFFLGIDTDLEEGMVLPPKEWFSVRISDISLGGAGVSIKDNLLPFCVEGGRYLLSLSIGGTAFFLVGKLVKILKKNGVNVEVGLAYEGLTTIVEKVMGGYIRQQELITRG